MSKKATISLVKRALRYASFGLQVLPMHTAKNGKCSCFKGSGCNNPGKHPATDNGVKDASTDRVIIKRFWKRNPDANIGIATGTKSNIVVLDIDPRNGGNETLAALESDLGPLPVTVTSQTGGGGLHLIFAHPGVHVPKDNSGKLLGPGVDVLSDNCIIVAPPSRHVSGVRYRWKEERSFRDLKPSALPQRWQDRISKPNDDPPPQGDIIVEGKRNSTLTSLAGTMKQRGMSDEAVLAALLAENQTRCKPPLEKSEVKKIASSATNFKPVQNGDRTDDAEQLLGMVLKDHFQDGRHLIFGADGRFWHYSGKVWSVVQAKWIEGRILDTIKKHALRTSQKSAHLIRQVRNLLEAQLSATGDPFGFVADPPRVINCANGELWVADDGSVEIKPHCPESYLRHLLDVSYDAEARCPQYDKALLEIFSETKKPKALRRHWQELVGYLIQNRRDIPLIIVLLGHGANGKTLLARTIVALIGPAQVHSQRVEELDKNRFALGSLLGKLLFLDDDVRAGARLPDGTLKMISEAKEVTGENKFKPSFSFVVRTVPMLLCNNVPSLADVSHGMLRRLMVIPFDRTFSAAEKDSGLFDRISQTELSGVLNSALRGYARLLKRGRFNEPAAVRRATASWLRQANPIPAFIDECCDLKSGARCRVQDLYRAYKTWATDSGFTLTQNKISFGRNMEHLGHRKIRGTGGYPVWLGVKLR